MRTNSSCVKMVLTTAAIVACILLPVRGIAAEPSVNERMLQAAENGSLDQIRTMLASPPVGRKRNDRGLGFQERMANWKSLEHLPLSENHSSWQPVKNCEIL